MARGKITNCEVIVANLFDVDNATYQTSKVGTLMAANSPQNRKLASTVDPVRDSEGNISRNSAGQPQVKIQYQPQRTRTVLTSPTCDGTEPDAPIETNFTLTKYAQLTPIQISGSNFNKLCNEAFDNLEMGPGNNIVKLKKGIKKTKLIGWLNEEIGQYVNSLLDYVNQQILTALLAGVGVNAKYGVATAQSIELFNSADGAQRPYFYDELGDVWRVNDLSGTPIVIGGLNIDRFRRRFDIACCSDIGVDYAKMGSKMPFEYYYDAKLAATFGADQFLVIAPNSFAFVSYPRYEYLMTANGTSEHANSQYGVFSINELGVDSGGRVLDIDLKIRQVDCDPAMGNEPYWQIIPSISYEPFIKPTGLSYASGPLQNVNGVFRYIGT